MTELPDPAAAERLRRIGGTKLLRQMIELFLQHTPERLAAADAALASGQLAEAERAWHSLKTSAGNLGAAQLQQLAQDAEDAAAGGDLESARRAGVAVRTACGPVIERLRQLLEESA